MSSVNKTEVHTISSVEPPVAIRTNCHPTEHAEVHPNAKIIEQFFRYFAERNYQKMQQCLHPKVTFSDIGFDLRGKQVAAMWHMICEKDVNVIYNNVRADDVAGEADWECIYIFQQDENSRGRKVHNVIAARFRFEDGLIREHRDECNFRTWARQALGFTGWLLGGTQFLRKQVRKKAAERIAKFIGDHPEYA